MTAGAFVKVEIEVLLTNSMLIKYHWGDIFEAEMLKRIDRGDKRN